MRHEVSEVPVCSQQNISRMCFVCGTENTFGLHAKFLELEDGRLCAEFVAQDQHQSYPGRMHGGIISTILDEVIGRTIQITDPDVFGVTIELNVHFRKPVPLNTPVRVVAEITEQKERHFTGEAKLLLDDGSVAANATARYLKKDTRHIVDGGLTDADWYPDQRELPDSVVV